MGQRALDVETAPDGRQFDLGHGMSQGERLQRVHPGRKGFEMGHHTGNAPITPIALALIIARALEMALKITGEPRCPGHTLRVALLSLHVAQEQREVALLHFLRRQAGGNGAAKIMRHPRFKALGPIGALRLQRHHSISYRVLGHGIPQK
jgi:hypothetical protein